MKSISSVAAIIASLALPATAHAYSASYVFGDSLSDAANLYAATGGAQPAAPYVDGQFSNGPVWVQDLSTSLGLGPVVPSLLGGNDYPFGGAVTGYLGSSPVPTLQQQVSTFIAGLSGSAPSTALYSVWIGANDLFAILDGDPSVAVADTKGAATAETTAIATLAANGAKDFIVPLVPNLGLTPDATASGAAAVEAATQLSQLYDATLTAELQALEAADGISVTIVDTYDLLDSAVNDPAAYGFTNVTAPCHEGPYTGGGTVCTDPSQYLFWDGVHPAAAGQAIIAAQAEADLPEPDTLATLGIGLAGIALLRRRSAPLLPSRHA